MLNIIRIISAIITGALAVYLLITGNAEVMPYMMFFMGVMLLAMGMSEVIKERKRMGIISIVVSLFAYYVSMQGFLLNFTTKYSEKGALIENSCVSLWPYYISDEEHLRRPVNGED